MSDSDKALYDDDGHRGRGCLRNTVVQMFKILQQNTFPQVLFWIHIINKYTLGIAYNTFYGMTSQRFRRQTTGEQIQAENPHSVILTGDFNCRSPQWWTGDVQQPEGTALDELIEVNNLHQLIEEPTNIREGSMSCIDLIITDQPNLFADYGVHPSLDEHCQHQIVYGKINISIPSPPPYKRTIWDYSKANTQRIHHDLRAIDRHTRFDTLGLEEMTEVFTASI